MTAVATVVGVYGYYFPNVTAYRCSGEIKIEITETSDGAKKNSSFFTNKEYGEIKEYWRGLKYTLANYKMSECSNDGAVVICGNEDANGKPRFSSFDIHKSLYSYTWTYTNIEKETEYIADNIECKRVASILEK